MRQAVLLGARLAWRGEGASRLRSSLVALATLVGATILLGAAGLVSADVVAQPARYADRSVVWLAMALVVGVTLPVLVLAATVGRLSAGLRGQRLAALRLLGLTAARVRVVAMVETGLAALLGSLGAVLVAWALRPALTLVPVWGQTYPAGAIVPRWWLTTAVVVAVPLVVVLVSSAPERLGQARVLGGVRRAEARRPSPWRLLPLAVGIAWCGGFAVLLRTDRITIRDTAVVGVNLVGSVTVLGVGVLLVVPVLVRLVGDLLLRWGRSPAVHLGARRIQAQPAMMTRVVSGLLIGLFVVTGARCVVVAFESTAQYQRAAHALEVEQSATVRTVDPGPGLHDRLAALPGVREVVGYHQVYTEQDRCTMPGDCLTGAVISCADLAIVAPRLRGCRDDQAMLLYPHADLPAALTWSATDLRTSEVFASVDLPAPTYRAARRGDVDRRPAGFDPDVIIPPGALGADALLVGPVDFVVTADPGRDLVSLITPITPDAFTGWSVEDYDYVAMLRALVWSIGALVISLGLLSFGIAAVDRAVERRREVAALQVVGVPASVLRRAQWIEVAAPLVVGSSLAVAAGLSAGATYLSLDADARLPWQATALLALLGVVGGVLLASLTVLASSPRLRPELIRAE